MKGLLLASGLAILLGACGNTDKSATGSASAEDIKAIQFVATQDGQPMEIDTKMFDTPAAKEFLSTGKNPYIGNEEAIKEGKKKFNLFSCVACHGGHGEGAVGPGLTGENFRYAKNATNKGMFETIWHGTNGGMGAKGFGLMAPDDGLKPDDVLKVIAFIRSHAKITGNE
ncbi:cytochrome c-L [Methylophilus rhizosphaerae]|uniref:Cytochrome c-L n=1 Tax=Methylophilus rhizosphaerae TaxID=492660 RepID=A0A1G9CTM9_9PROT|nr:cytochrome c [Methylophilus rhizosphaerae]SDK55050.1 cytochrome c-L [Methylophilus rhizosphaerae]